MVWNEGGLPADRRHHQHPAIIITLAVTAILVVGIKESARFNTAIVLRQGRR